MNGCYRLTSDECVTHLARSGDPFPESTLANAERAEGKWTHAYGGSVAYDAGFYWVRTTTLRVSI